MTFFVSSDPAQCFVYDITNPESLPQTASESSVRTSYTETVLEGVPDGSYEIVVACVDIYGNVVQDTYPIRTNADVRAGGLQPTGVIDTNEFTLEFTTVDEVECRYSQNLGDEFADMSQIFQREDQVAEFRQFATITRAQGQHFFNIACDFNGQDARMQTTIIVDTDRPTATHEMQSNKNYFNVSGVRPSSFFIM